MQPDKVSDLIVHFALTTFYSMWNMELKDELTLEQRGIIRMTKSCFYAPLPYDKHSVPFRHLHLYVWCSTAFSLW